MNVEAIIKELKKAPPNSRLYLGADSVRFTKKDKTAWAKITVVAVIHLAGRNGCKVIGLNEIEQVFDKNLSRPQYRMMQEVYKLSEFYLQIAERMLEEGIFDYIPIELHLDIATDEKYGSSCAAKQAFGYIKGVCGITPIMKPTAWAASTAADLYNKKLVA